MVLEANAVDGRAVDPATEEWLPIPVAALRRNLSVDAVRRRLKSGQLRGRRARGERGPRWEVFLGGPADGMPPEAEPARRGSDARRRGARGAMPDGRWVELMRQLLS